MDKHEFRDIQKKLGLRIDEVAEVLGVELFTVQQWASGTWSIPRIAEKFLLFLQSKQEEHPLDIMGDAYKLDYDKGLASAHIGYVEGYRTGFDKGYCKESEESIVNKELTISKKYDLGFTAGYTLGTYIKGLR